MDDFVEPLLLNLIDVDNRVPRCEKRRCPVAISDLRRQSVHLVAEKRLVVRRQFQIELLDKRSKLVAQSVEELLAPDLKRVLVWPELLHDLQRRVLTVGLDYE